MASASRYLILRTDRGLDETVVEVEGLKIGRSPDSDIVLNHRTVDPAHAGIKEIDGEYWISNLSASAGLVFNGRLVQDAPIHSGDLARIGPYGLRFEPEPAQGTLTIVVELGSSLTGVQPARPSRSVTAANSLGVYWEKRMRESGKIGGETRMQPQSGRRVGKALANWRPTFDLREPWRLALFLWAGLIVLLAATAFILVHRQAYSPGRLADAHAKKSGASCSDCHAVTARKETRCIACHEKPGFQAAVSEAHRREGMTCISCHTEHKGPAGAGLLKASVCTDCHNGVSLIHAGARAGERLPVPHEGAAGYPVKNKQWLWKGLAPARWKQEGLPEVLAGRPHAEQFHAIHRAIFRGSRMACPTCHTSGVASVDRASCGRCHASENAPDCASCHPPHGESRRLRALVASAGSDFSLLQQVTAMPFVVPRESPAATHMAVPWLGWPLLLGFLAAAGMGAFFTSAAHQRRDLRRTLANASQDQKAATKVYTDGPAYPHPVIDPLLCIGCHACVEACPHDVIDIVNGVAFPIALDQCMEDTACMVECPTSPKACVVVNTKKVIPPRKVPRRNQAFLTDVPGIYLIGDVSGIPLIKNALNEGAQVIKAVQEDLREAVPVQAEFDVAIIGMGPAGLSATAAAAQRSLQYVAIEQNRVASTLESFPAGKYVFFKPDSVETRSLLPLPGAGGNKEELLQSWKHVISANELVIHEEERCSGIQSDNGVFRLTTRTTAGGGSYTARRVILAIGNHGSPMKLGVKGEDSSTPLGDRVRYKLADPAEFDNRQCIVVGAGNSAIEAAVDLAGFRREGNSFHFIRTNKVSLVVRSDFKGDLKLGNKMNIYDCMDAGRIRVYFRTGIKEILPSEVVLADARSGEEKARIANDVIFALIGTERPTKFLQSLGIKIG